MNKLNLKLDTKSGLNYATNKAQVVLMRMSFVFQVFGYKPKYWTNCVCLCVYLCWVKGNRMSLMAGPETYKTWTEERWPPVHQTHETDCS